VDDLAETEAAVAKVKTDVRATLTPLEAKHVAVLDALRDALPDDGFVASDMTQIAYTGNTFFEARGPRGWLHPVGYGTLGYALPAAIGAKLAAPERPGVVLIGDGGLLFTVQELATAAELRLPLAIVLWNNDALGEIEDSMARRGVPKRISWPWPRHSTVALIERSAWRISSRRWAMPSPLTDRP
jgi:thiamine pyrophosphate-dependent acetolactate synthase large subunit-like protein